MEKHEVMFSNLIEMRKLTALEDKVIWEYSNRIDYSRFEYEYSELKSKIVRGRKGDSRWTEIGFSIVIGTVFVTILISIAFPGILSHPVYKFIPMAFIPLALVVLSFRLIKYDCVWFDDTEGEYAFMIKMNKNNRMQGEKTIEFILDKIGQFQSNTESKAKE